jgi:hypothetical protein
MRLIHHMRTSIFVFLAFIGMIMTTQVDAKEPFQVTSSFLLTSDREAALEPLAIKQAFNGDFVIAGDVRASQQAWATRINPEGKVLWAYYLGFDDADKIKFSHTVAAHPEFRGIVSKPNGDVYLCGSMSHASGDAPTSLLVHLDSDGKLLQKRFIPGPPMKIGADVLSVRYYFDDCMDWNDGIAIIGRGTYFSKSASENIPRQRHLYWLVVLDSDGAIKWQKQIPTLANDFALLPGEISLTTMGKNLVIVATNNVDTEIALLEASGEIKARTNLKGRFILIREENSKETLQLLGPSSNTGLSREVYFFNENLEQVKHIRGSHPKNFVPIRAYRGVDQSIVVFGASVHSFGERYRTSVASVDPLLQSEKLMDMDDSKFSDGGWIRAVSSTKDYGQFAIARPWVDRSSDVKDKNVSPGFKRGGILDLVKQK